MFLKNYFCFITMIIELRNNYYKKHKKRKKRKKRKKHRKRFFRKKMVFLQP